MPLDVSEDGEAANTEIGLLLGITGRLMSGPLSNRLPSLDVDALAMLGQRDESWRRQFNVGSLADHGIWLRSYRSVAEAPAQLAESAVEHVASSSNGWWLHVDLDVLDPVEFPAQGLPDVEDEPGGLTFAQLTELCVAAIRVGGCIGWSIAIYDPEQDPDRSGARNILRLVADVTDAIGS